MILDIKSLFHGVLGGISNTSTNTCVLRFSERPQGFSDFGNLISAWQVQFNRFPDQTTYTYTFAKKITTALLFLFEDKRGGKGGSAKTCAIRYN